jgi:hypothetical protein
MMQWIVAARGKKSYLTEDGQQQAVEQAVEEVRLLQAEEVRLLQAENE